LENIWITLIDGILTLAGVCMTVLAANKKASLRLEAHQAVTETKIDELTREVREHNHFAKRMPVVEEQIKVINHRLTDLERGQE